MLKWAGITFGIGIVLLIVDIYLGSQKKEGITPADKRRFWGIFTLTILMALLVGAMLWLSEV